MRSRRMRCFPGQRKRGSTRRPAASAPSAGRPALPARPRFGRSVAPGGLILRHFTPHFTAESSKNPGFTFVPVFETVWLHRSWRPVRPIGQSNGRSESGRRCFGIMHANHTCTGSDGTNPMEKGIGTVSRHADLWLWQHTGFMLRLNSISPRAAAAPARDATVPGRPAPKRL